MWFEVDRRAVVGVGYRDGSTVSVGLVKVAVPHHESVVDVEGIDLFVFNFEHSEALTFLVNG